MTKAISLWQPWAQWVVEGIKTIETRTHDRFKSLVGQRIAIHATKKYDENAEGLALSWMFTKDFLGRYREAEFSRIRIDSKRNRGVIIGTVFVSHVGWLDDSHSSLAMID